MSEEELYTLWKADKESHLDFEMWLYNKGKADGKAEALNEIWIDAINKFDEILNLEDLDELLKAHK